MEKKFSIDITRFTLDDLLNFTNEVVVYYQGLGLGTKSKFNADRIKNVFALYGEAAIELKKNHERLILVVDLTATYPITFRYSVPSGYELVPGNIAQNRMIAANQPYRERMHDQANKEKLMADFWAAHKFLDGVGCHIVVHPDSPMHSLICVDDDGTIPDPNDY